MMLNQSKNSIVCQHNYLQIFFCENLIKTVDPT
jgi:hypothetical protein